MTPPVLIAFAVSFAAGPLLYLLMTAADVSPALLIALAAGVLSFLSPCVLPIVPPYLAISRPMSR